MLECAAVRSLSALFPFPNCSQPVMKPICLLVNTFSTDIYSSERSVESFYFLIMVFFFKVVILLSLSVFNSRWLCYEEMLDKSSTRTWWTVVIKSERLILDLNLYCFDHTAWEPALLSMIHELQLNQKRAFEALLWITYIL